MTWSDATPDVGRPLLQQLEDGREHADRGHVRARVLVPGRLPEVLAEQLVGAVDEVDLHGLSGCHGEVRRDATVDGRLTPQLGRHGLAQPLSSQGYRAVSCAA